MSLLTPSFGLLFWMVLSFAIVFGILAKFGFPVITRMVDERRDYIRHSLDAADEANKKLEGVKQESEAILNEAKSRQSEILKNAIAEGNQIIQDAKEKAAIEAQKQVSEAVRQIEDQKQKAINDIRTQVAMLSVNIAEKILRQELAQTENNQALVTKLLNEAESNMGKN